MPKSLPPLSEEDRKILEKYGPVMDRMDTLADELRKLGWSGGGIRSFLGEVGRENDYSEQVMSGEHRDHNNGQTNAGIVSWQKDRRDAFIKFMQDRGYADAHGNIADGPDALRAQAQFADAEMRQRTPDLAKMVRDPNADVKDIEPVMSHKYFGWDREGRYGLPNPEQHMAKMQFYTAMAPEQGPAAQLGDTGQQAPAAQYQYKFGDKDHLIFGGNNPQQHHLNDAQDASYKAFIKAGHFDQNAAPGSPGKPFVAQKPGEEQALGEGQFYFDVDGKLHQTPTLENNQTEGLWQGLRHPIDNLAGLLKTGLDYIPVGQHGLGTAIDNLGSSMGMNTYDQSIQMNEQHLRDLARQGQKPGRAGEIVGEMATSLIPAARAEQLGTRGLEALGMKFGARAGGVALGGAVQGGMTTNEHTVGGVAKDMGIGAAANLAGDQAFRWAGRAIAPEIDPIRRSMIDAGAKLTPGQTMGRVPQAIEERFRSVIPFAGGGAAKASDSFAPMVVNQVMTTHGLPKVVAKTGRDALRDARDVLDDQLDRIHPHDDGDHLDDIAQASEHLDTLDGIANTPEARARQGNFSPEQLAGATDDGWLHRLAESGIDILGPNAPRTKGNTRNTILSTLAGLTGASNIPTQVASAIGLGAVLPVAGKAVALGTGIGGALESPPIAAALRKYLTPGAFREGTRGVLDGASRGGALFGGAYASTADNRPAPDLNYVSGWSPPATSSAPTAGLPKLSKEDEAILAEFRDIPTDQLPK